jgi:hypothetical protein
MPFVRCVESVERSCFEVHQAHVGARQDAKDFVKLALQCGLLAGLAVLKGEDHYQRDRGS